MQVECKIFLYWWENELEPPITMSYLTIEKKSYKWHRVLSAIIASISVHKKYNTPVITTNGQNLMTYWANNTWNCRRKWQHERSKCWRGNGDGEKGWLSPIKDSTKDSAHESDTEVEDQNEDEFRNRSIKRIKYVPQEGAVRYPNRSQRWTKCIKPLHFQDV